MDSKQNNNNNDETQITETNNNNNSLNETNQQLQQQQQKKHNIFYLRVAYFSTFVARGSLFPFLGVILRARGSSYLLVGIAMNISAITRLVASSVFASMTTTPDKNNDTNLPQQQQSPLHFSKKVILVCLIIAIAASTVFTLSPASPQISAVSVATLLCASSISSLVLDSVAIKLFSDQKEESNNEPQQEQEHFEGSEDVEASSTYGKVRLFGSLGWGIAAPLQVLLMTLIYNSNNSDPTTSTTTTTFDKNDLRAWFPSKNVATAGGSDSNNSNNNSPLLATNLIFLVGYCMFLYSVQQLTSSVSSTRRTTDKEDKELETVSSKTTQRVEETTSMVTENNNNNNEGKARTVHVPQPQQPRRSFTLFQLIWALRSALLFAVLYGLCDDVVGTFFFPFLRKELSVPLTIISIIPTINVVSELPVLAMSKWFHKNYSIATLHLVFISLWAVRFSWYAFVLVSTSSSTLDVNSGDSGSSIASSNLNQTTSTSSLAPSNFFFLFKIFIVEPLNGLCFAGAFVLCMRHAVWIATKEIFVDVQRAVPLVHSSFFGVSSIIGGLCGGLLAEYFGVRMLFALMAMICFFVAIGLFMKQLFVKII